MKKSVIGFLMFCILLVITANSATAQNHQIIIADEEPAGGIGVEQIHQIIIAAGEETEYTVNWEWYDPHKLTSDLNNTIIQEDTNGFISSIESSLNKGFTFPGNGNGVSFPAFTVHIKIPQDTPTGEYTASTLFHTIVDSRNMTGEWVDVLQITVTAAPIKVDIVGGLIGSIANNHYADTKTRQISEEYMRTFSGGFPAEGLTADGNSRLLVRICSSAPVTLSLMRQQLTALGITVETLDTKSFASLFFDLRRFGEGEYQKTFVLKAPEAWPGDPTAAKISFNVALQNNAGELLWEKSLILRRTPVVLIHGTWSNESAFSSMRSSLLQHGYKYDSKKNYGSNKEVYKSLVYSNSYDNWEGPSRIVLQDEGKNFYTNFFAAAKRDAVSEQIELTKVDVVAHSLGGLIAKAFATSNSYKRPENYKQGAFRRLITLGTPHWGSGFASYVVSDDTYLRNKAFSKGSTIAQEKWQTVCNILSRVGNRLDGSALTDQNMYSDIIRELNAYPYNIPMFLIVGDDGRIIDLGFTGIQNWFLTESVEALFMFPYKHEDLFNDFRGILQNPMAFNDENSDGTVGLSSASWALPTGFAVDKRQSYSEEHTNLESDGEIISKVRGLLNGPLSNFDERPKAYKFPGSTLSRAMPAVMGKESAVQDDLSMEAFQRLTLSVDRTTVSPGDTVTFSVTADNGIVLDRAGAVYQGEPFVDLSQKGPNNIFQGSLKIPETFSGIKTFAAIGSAGEEFYGSKQTVSITVKPNLTNLLSIYTEPGVEINCSEGFTRPIRTIGVLADGTEYDITRSELGTTYSVGDPLLVTVTQDGIFEALKAGKTVITINNGNVNELIYVDVVPSEDPPLDNDDPADNDDPIENPDHSGSGGCNTGLGAGAMFAALTLATTYRKRQGE